MILILINWIYIIFTSFSLGFAVSGFIRRKLRYEMKSIDLLVFIGIVTATVYAQFFSIFYKVGFLANVILIITSLVIYFIYRKKILIYLKYIKAGITPAGLFGIILLTLIWCYCTSRGYMHYDSDLYHAQSIRWIEEFGVVKGLGNIHVRFAYNSSFFALQALYSMKFIVGDSLHAVNGLIALLLSLEVMKLIYIPAKKSVDISDFARIGAFYYLTIIYSDITSPATDYTITCIIFYLVIKWLILLEREENSYVPYSLICVAFVYALTIKLTAGVILILVVKPAYMLLRDKKWKEIVTFILMGIIIVFPWITRTVIISGYLLYPFPSIDIFNVDWKIPKIMAIYDAAEIKTWGRGLYNADLVDIKISEWFPNWFNTTLPTIGKILIIFDIICIVVFAVLVIGAIIKKIRLGNELLILGAIIASYIFWQIQAPLLRYGYAYVLLVGAITIGIVWGRLSEKINKYALISSNVICAIILALIAVKSISLIKYVRGNAEQPYYVKQEGYGEYELDSYDVNGVTFYYSTEGDRVGYKYFPAIPSKTDIIFRGDDMSSGFRSFPLLQDT